MSQEHLHEPLENTQWIEQLVEAIHRQNPRLQLLRALGISHMIEQEADTKIAPLVFEDDPNQPPTVDVKRTDKMASLTLHDGYFNEGWILDPLPLRMSDGSFDTTLRIKATRVTNQQLESFANTHDMQSVLIEFTKDNHLQVVGGKTTFGEDLTTVNEALLARVQVGIKEAFTNPRTESGLKLEFA